MIHPEIIRRGMQMLTNKELKQRGRRAVRGHYLLFLMLCAVAVIFGNEFGANDGILYVTELFGNGTHQEQSIDMGTPDQSAQAKGTDSTQDKLTDLKDSVEALHDIRAGRIGIQNRPATEVIKDILDNHLLDGIALADSLEKQFEESGTDVVGHTEGVLAYVINTVTSGTLAIHCFEALDAITGSDEAAVVLFTLIGLALYSFFGIGIPEIYAVVLRRYFLEARVYEKVPLQHGFHLLKVRRCTRATLVIVLKDLFYILWCFTIAGAFIKRYSYYLVPYIAAENPDIRPRQAIELSRRMMDGHKMEAFKFELSFLHWLLLGVLTVGLSNVFYYLPYKIASTAEYYACVRQMAKDAQIEGTELLDDEALLAKAGQPLLEKAYADVGLELEQLERNAVELQGAQKFFGEKFGIWIGRSEDKVIYQEQENRRFRLEEAGHALRGEVYPVRLDPRVNDTNRKVSHQINFLRCYTIWSLFSMFLLFAFIGWIWEVILFLLQTGTFVNRGTLYGPWIPIYGTGGALIIVLLSSLRKKPLAEFFAIVVLCGTIEYVTSWALEKLHGMRWWDYSGYFLNLDGRICAEGLIAFGVLGLMGIYILAPALDTLFMKINAKYLSLVTTVLMILFFCDVVYSQIHPHTGAGITDMGARQVTAEKQVPEHIWKL